MEDFDVAPQNMNYASALVFIQRIRKKYLSYFRYRLCWKEQYKKLYFRKSYSCYHCQKSFIAKKILESHTLRYHSKGTHKFQCSFCNFVCDADIKLRIHSKIHLKDLPYQCADCGKRCRTVRALSFHVNHHKKLDCHKCGRTFLNKYKLRKHVHKACGDCVCNFCHRIYTPYFMKLHIRINHIVCDKEQMFCAHCGITVQPRCLLLKHRANHKKLRERALVEIRERFQNYVKPYKLSGELYVRCPFCNKVTKNSDPYSHFENHISNKFRYSLPLNNKSWKLAVMLQLLDKAVKENENDKHLNSLTVDDPSSSQLFEGNSLDYLCLPGEENELQSGSIDTSFPSCEKSLTTTAEFLPHSTIDAFDKVDLKSIVTAQDHIGDQVPVSHVVSDVACKGSDLEMEISPENIAVKEKENTFVMKTEYIEVKEEPQQQYSDFECLENKPVSLPKDMYRDEGNSKNNDELVFTNVSATTYPKQLEKGGIGDLRSLKGTENSVIIFEENPETSNSKDIIDKERTAVVINDNNFSPESTLENKKSSNSSKVYTCSCNISYSMKFYSKVAFMNHKKQHAKNKCECPRLGKISSPEDFLLHQNICVEDCVANFQKYESLYPRTTNVNSVTLFRIGCCFPCFSCKRCFSRKETLLKHVKRLHQQGLYCTSCQMIYPTINVFHTHIRYNEVCRQLLKKQWENAKCRHNHEKKQMEDTENAFVSDTSKNISQSSISPGKEYKCPACRKKFYDREVFAAHVFRHEKLKWYICPDCSLSFWLKEGLIEHCHSVHPENYITEEKLQKWRTQFGINSELKVLIEKLLMCRECGEYYGTSQEDFQRHITFHKR